MSQIPFQMQQQINAEMKNRLRKEFIPIDANLAVLIDAVNSILHKSSAKDLGLTDYSDYKELKHPSKDGMIRMDIAGAVINRIGDVSPDGFGQGGDWYETTLEIAFSAAKDWNERKVKIFKSLEREMTAKAKIIQGGGKPKIYHN